MYRRGDAGLSHKNSLSSSKNILNKWYREKDGIETSYDKEGNYDSGWIRLQKQLEKERAAKRPNNEELGFENKQKRLKL